MSSSNGSYRTRRPLSRTQRHLPLRRRLFRSQHPPPHHLRIPQYRRPSPYPPIPTLHRLPLRSRRQMRPVLPRRVQELGHRSRSHKGCIQTSCGRRNRCASNCYYQPWQPNWCQYFHR
jgi:hypothetical protein